MTENDILVRGFKPYPVPSLKTADAFWQKTVRDEQGVWLYGISLYRYDLGKLRPGRPEGWMAGMRFYLGKNDYHNFGDIEISLEPETDIGWVEGWCAKAFRVLRAIPDPHND